MISYLERIAEVYLQVHTIEENLDREYYCQKIKRIDWDWFVQYNQLIRFYQQCRPLSHPWIHPPPQTSSSLGTCRSTADKDWIASHSIQDLRGCAHLYNSTPKCLKVLWLNRHNRQLVFQIKWASKVKGLWRTHTLTQPTAKRKMHSLTDCKTCCRTGISCSAILLATLANKVMSKYAIWPCETLWINWDKKLLPHFSKMHTETSWNKNVLAKLLPHTLLKPKPVPPRSVLKPRVRHGSLRSAALISWGRNQFKTAMYLTIIQSQEWHWIEETRINSRSLTRRPLAGLIHWTSSNIRKAPPPSRTTSSSSSSSASQDSRSVWVLPIRPKTTLLTRARIICTVRSPLFIT